MLQLPFFFIVDTVTVADLGPFTQREGSLGLENKGSGISGGRAPSGGRREFEARDKAPVPADARSLGRQRQGGQQGYNVIS